MRRFFGRLTSYPTRGCRLRKGGEPTFEDEKQIRGLIERWVTAVHAGDLDMVVADHASDTFDFDVPPPAQGVRWIDAYHAALPGYFE